MDIPEIATPPIQAESDQTPWWKDWGWLAGGPYAWGKKANEAGRKVGEKIGLPQLNFEINNAAAILLILGILLIYVAIRSAPAALGGK